MVLAERTGRAAEAEELLFEAIYERGQNVADAATLQALGEELGLNRVSRSRIDCPPMQRSAPALSGRCVGARQHFRSACIVTLFIVP